MLGLKVCAAPSGHFCFYLDILVSMRQECNVVVLCISLMTKYLFMCLLAIYVPGDFSGEMPKVLVCLIILYDVMCI